MGTKRDRTEYLRQWRLANKDKMAEYSKRWRDNNLDQIRQIDRNRQRERRKNNPEAISRERRKWYYSTKGQFWYACNRDLSRIRDRDRQRRERSMNPDLVNEKQRNYRRRSINARIAHNIRSRVSTAIKGIVKSGSGVRDMGCSIDVLIKHLEEQFKNGMSWDNYGEWHIDHIIPLSSVDLTKREDFLQVCHYTNLQPLWALENYSKGSKCKL